MLVYAFIAVLILLLPVLLAGLKLDMTLTSLAAIYVPVSAVIIAVFFAAVIFRRIKASKNGSFPVKRTPEEKKSLAVIIAAAAILWCFSYVILSPSGVCDNTRETAAVTLLSDTLYEYSAFTGEKMVAGQPIFNKIQLMPVFYASVSRVSGVPLWILTGVLVPLLVFACNIFLVCRLSLKLFGSDERLRLVFVLGYLWMLVAGTYVPDVGIPVTLGYAILRMGYSGWAVCYGIVIPAAFLCLSEKKYVKALITLIPVPGLVRPDKILFSLLDPVNTVKSINNAGKIFFLYILALLVLFLFSFKDKKKIPVIVFFFPAVTVAYTVAMGSAFLSKKKEYVALIAGSFIVILSATGLRPYADGHIEAPELRRAKAIEALLPNGSKLLAKQETLDLMRLYFPEVRIPYSRAVNNPYLSGLDFESVTEHYGEYSYFSDFYGNEEYVFHYYGAENAVPLTEVLENAVLEGVNAVAIPAVKEEDYEREAFSQTGFKFAGNAEDCVVYVR